MMMIMIMMVIMMMMIMLHVCIISQKEVRQSTQMMET
jgi:hypothetical protein